MKHSLLHAFAILLPFVGVLPAQTAPVAVGQQGERVSPELLGNPVLETFEEVLAREALSGPGSRFDPKARNGARGEWEVQKKRHAVGARSGTKYVFNRWGDTRLGVGFGQPVQLRGAWVARHGTKGLETPRLRVVGYRDGRAVSRTDWFEEIGERPSWFEIDLQDVDRVEFVAQAAHNGSGWFALDDLAYAVHEQNGATTEVVVDFEALAYRQRLTGSGYAGLVWERGTGPIHGSPTGMPPSHRAGDSPQPDPLLAEDEEFAAAAAGGTRAPRLIDAFGGPSHGDAGTLGVPDTNGAVGPQHYLAAPNGNLSVYSRATGQRIASISQTNFWGSGAVLGDPRVVYDHHHDRFVMLSSNWTDRIYLAYSLTDDPLGTWFKTSIFTPVGPDAGTWPDYPTLGLDENGIYIGVFQVFQSMTIFAIDKAPLLAPTPTLGTVTAWRGLPIEGAIQPCVTFGDSGGAYLVSEASTGLRLRQITGSLAAPLLSERGIVSVPAYSTAPDVPQAGTSVFLGAASTRPMNAVYRNGSVWTTHCIDVDGRAAVRWYRIDPSTAATTEVGTVSDPVRSYFMPSITANKRGDVFLGFSGSSPSQFASAYGTGRRVTDPLGSSGTPRLFRNGAAPYTYLSSGGTSRWGDYSVSGIDPVDDLTFWTIQERAGTGNVWELHIGAFRYPIRLAPPPQAR